MPVRLLRAPLFLATLLGGFALYVTLAVPVYQLVSGAFVALAMLGVVVSGLTMCLIIARIVTATPPPGLRPLAERGESYAALVVVNLIILSFFAPAFQMIAMLPSGNPLTPRAFAGMGRLSARVLFVLFTVAVMGLAWLFVLRCLQAVVGESAAARRVGRVLDRGVMIVIALYCAGGMVLIYNALLDRSPPAVQRADVVAIGGFDVPLGLFSVTWIDVTSWRRPGGTERVLTIPERDGLYRDRLRTGLPVRVQTRDGFLGLPWIEGLRVDRGRLTEQALEAVPGAAAFRKWVIALRLQEKRWQDVRALTEAHYRLYPNDGDYVRDIAKGLRGYGREEDAAALEQLVRS